MEKWALLQIEGPGKGRLVALGQVARVVGRGAESDIPIVDTMASRRHASLRAGGGGCLLTDEGSANGTFVYGERVKERLLALGETFSIGQCAFNLIREDEMLAVGHPLGVWEIKELLGVDTVAWRYRARQKILEREVELEVIRPSFTDDADLLELLRSLLRRVAAATDQSVVPVFDLAEHDDRFLVARRLTPLVTVAWDDLTLKERGERIGELLTMLEHWAERGAGVPLSLAQLTLGPDGHLLFRLPATLDLYLVRQRLHTQVPAYMSHAAPEELAGGPPTSRAELYRLGVLIFQALTGQLPREGRTRAEFAQALGLPLPDARDIVPQIPARAAQLTAGLLALNPAARPELASVAKEWGSLQFPARRPAPAKESPARLAHEAATPARPAWESAPAARPARDAKFDTKVEKRRVAIPTPAAIENPAMRVARTLAALAAAAGIFFISSRIVYWLLERGQ
jgi:hypothetical protein